MLFLGAIIINGHEHNYARSKPITYYTEPMPRYINISAGVPIVVQPGQTFLATVGTAGQVCQYDMIKLNYVTVFSILFTHNVKDIDPCVGGRDKNPWWGAAKCSPAFTDSGTIVFRRIVLFVTRLIIFSL